MGSLQSTGNTIALIGALVAIILTVLSLVDITIDILAGLSVNLGLVPNEPVLTLIFALILLLITTGRVSLSETVILGIVVIILGVLIGGIGGLLAIIGGVLIILDILTTGG